MKNSRRIAQLNELIREIIGSILIEEDNDPALSKLTVTEVSTSSDFSHAKVFYMPRYQTDGSLATIPPDALSEAVLKVQKKLAPQLHLRRIPHLHFIRDEAEERGAKIDEILRRVKDDLEHD